MQNTIRVKGIREVIQGLNQLERKSSDPTGPLNRVGREMLQTARINFYSKGAAYNEAWPPLREITKQIKKERGFGGKPIMVRTGNLMNSFKIVGPRRTGNGGIVEVINPVWYAKFHQYGFGRVPRRVLLKITNNQVARIRRIAENWLLRIIRSSFQGQ